ncbi:GNAT family N-acetyltransferase [Cesiribacter sp. SM1]|uniref:GNAT family N-acetyltransferase n=1 Tax=Cesiribacter sp. SM1 TaxID=2861196 RepID=UPI001CD1C286|nr:GNAT family N-acetyltransferase [Cesiribacter sp. SM1]
MNQQAAVVISTDKSKINIDYVHHFLSTKSYWAKGIPSETVAKAINNSLCFVVLKNDVQIGFARVITDYTTFAYLADVFIDPGHRGFGYSKILVAEIVGNPQLQGLRRWMLMTADAHSLYEQFGFSMLAKPERAMEISNPDIYTKAERQ